MIKILIVDDEKIVIDAIQFILDNGFSGRIEYEAARSGREAIEKAELFGPDIVLMDIRMPGINGIDAIREIKRIKPRARFIIISAYEQFEFAKEAIELKVDDYILKPINKQNLTNVLEATIDRIRTDRESKKRELETIEKQESVLPYLENGFLYSVMMGEHYNNMSQQYREILEIPEEGGYIVVVEAYDTTPSSLNSISISVPRSNRSVETKDAAESRLDSKLYTAIREAFKFKCRCYVGPVERNRVVALIPVFEKDRHTQKNDALEIATYVAGKLKKLDDQRLLKACIGISKFHVLENISSCYDEALLAVKAASKGEVRHYSDIRLQVTGNQDYPDDYENRLIDKIAAGDYEGSIYCFNRIYEWIHQSFGQNFEMGRAVMIELFVALQRTLKSNGMKDVLQWSYLIELSQCNDYIALEKWCRNRLDFLIGNINSANSKNNSRIIVKAKEYIYENYQKDITLEDVAKEAAVTPHYLSRLFKEETGENFIEFLTIFRIKRAKRMMDNENINMNIKEICYQVGYADPNYFSRLFKKIEKITPTDYMKGRNRK